MLQDLREHPCMNLRQDACIPHCASAGVRHKVCNDPERILVAQGYCLAGCEPQEPRQTELKTSYWLLRNLTTFRVIWSLALALLSVGWVKL